MIGKVGERGCGLQHSSCEMSKLLGYGVQCGVHSQWYCGAYLKVSRQLDLEHSHHTHTQMQKIVTFYGDRWCLGLLW